MVGDFKNLLSKLIWLSWSDCPSELNATNLCLKKLAMLKLSGSNITENWAGWEPCLVSENLKVIQITSCESLKRTLDFSKCLNLKRLVVAGCTTSLVVAGSLSKLEHLKYLEIMSRGDQLRENCDLFVVPFVLSSPKSLSTLKIDTMPVLELHQSIEEMKGLNYLSTISCRIPRTLPDFIGKLNSLLVFKLENIEIAELPSSIGNLKRLEILYLDKIAIRELPRAIGMLENLKRVDSPILSKSGAGYSK
ncbi:disease resistance protein RPV1-like [Eucalyptus grandis]|uniref:disease resistance protein RPV1-like n=1 Tax=Eucalyptus grandis TaxID=71139 RepID=UPI00192F0F73|nr:disease resistance protein RPV1-like [Eucalyptus grandis]